MNVQSWCGAILATLVVSRLAPATPPEGDSQAALANTVCRLIRDAIPLEFEKRDGWGATKEIVVGLQARGNLRDFDVKRRRKAVDHGVWKHYRLRLVEPEQNLAVKLTRLESRAGGGVNFTLQIDARLDAWVRAKVYQRGVHLIALELEGDARASLEVAGEVVVHMAAVGKAPALAVQPRISDARLVLHDVQLRRISNAQGPIVRELGDGLAQILQEQLSGPPLTAKLNHAIDQKRDRLIFSAGELVRSDWWPLAAASSSPAAATRGKAP